MESECIILKELQDVKNVYKILLEPFYGCH